MLCQLIRSPMRGGSVLGLRSFILPTPLALVSHLQGQYASNPAMLAKEVLAEVPLQLTSYMKKHRIAPGAHM